MLVKEHSSYFFNSLPVIKPNGDINYATSFKREWSTSSKSVSRVAIYNPYGHKHNLNKYCEDYLPLLNSIAMYLNEMNHYFRCAVTGYKTAWRPTDVEMAAYYWWAQNADAR